MDEFYSRKFSEIILVAHGKEEQQHEKKEKEIKQQQILASNIWTGKKAKIHFRKHIKIYFYYIFLF